MQCKRRVLKTVYVISDLKLIFIDPPVTYFGMFILSRLDVKIIYEEKRSNKVLSVISYFTFLLVDYKTDE